MLKYIKNCTLFSILLFISILIGSIVIIFEVIIISYFRENLFLSLFISFLFLTSFIFVVLHVVIRNYIKVKTKIICDLFEMSNKKDHDILSELNKKILKWKHQEDKRITELQQKQRYTKDFIANVAHELKTPIFNIQGYVLTLLDGGIDDKKINLKYLKRASKNVKRMISTIQDIDTISQLESQVLKLNYERFNLVELIVEIFEMQEIRAQKRNITLTLKNDIKADYWVYADKQRISEVVNNLVVNSIKYGKNEGETQVFIENADENFYRVHIIDNGIGIKEKDIPRLFERFYRVDKSRSREMGGTGLGLAIVKHIIESHKLSINVKSTPDKGSAFSFTISKNDNHT